ncbi:MAG: hypothetical protein ACYS8Z_04430 [Planctomycetota bacterium]|jgi:hypothetical protein
MNRRQLIVLFVGIFAIAEWFLATENIDYPIYIRPAVGAISIAIIAALTYVLRDKEEPGNDEKKGE